MPGKSITALIVLAVTIGLLIDAVFIVDERKYAVVLQLGEIKGTDYEPGFHLKVPVIQNVRYFDRRILSLDKQPERYLTLEKKNVLVDFFAKWRIKDVGRYYRATGGFENVALERLSDIISRGLRNEFGTRTIQEAVSGERRAMVEALRAEASGKVDELGIELVDVQVKRIDLPDTVSDSVYARMRAERTRVASDLRARGREVAEGIRAEADREREVILANAYRESQLLRGDGDAKATAIYAESYGRNAEFYSFYRSLEVYRTGLSGKDDLLVLEPDSELFRYFRDSRGGK
ncbi:MAG: protease modulator HflC [Oceanococcaceae bacterium]